MASSLAAVYAASLILGVAITAAYIARTGGTRSIWYGTTVGNQIEAVRAIQNFSNASTVNIQFNNWQVYPIALQVLMELNPAPPGPRRMANLVVKYADSFPSDVRIEVREVSGRP
jgi:hypothetical protein